MGRMRTDLHIANLGCSCKRELLRGEPLADVPSLTVRSCDAMSSSCGCSGEKQSRFTARDDAPPSFRMRASPLRSVSQSNTSPVVEPVATCDEPASGRHCTSLLFRLRSRRRMVPTTLCESSSKLADGAESMACCKLTTRSSSRPATTAWRPSLEIERAAIFLRAIASSPYFTADEGGGRSPAQSADALAHARAGSVACPKSTKDRAYAIF